MKAVKQMVDQTDITFFQTLYDETYPAAAAYILRRSPDPAHAEDVLQDVYTEVFALVCKKGRGYIREPQALVLHIAKARLARSYPLWARLKATLPLFRQEDDGQEAEIPGLPADPLQLEDLVGDRALLAQVAAWLRQKPLEVQRVLYLYYALDWPARQIATELGMKESTVKSKIHRTVKELRERYGKDRVEP